MRRQLIIPLTLARVGVLPQRGFERRAQRCLRHNAEAERVHVSAFGARGIDVAGRGHELEQPVAAARQHPDHACPPGVEPVLAGHVSDDTTPDQLVGLGVDDEQKIPARSATHR